MLISLEFAVNQIKVISNVTLEMTTLKYVAYIFRMLDTRMGG